MKSKTPSPKSPPEQEEPQGETTPPVTAETLPSEQEEPEPDVPSPVQAVALPPEPEAQEPVHPREERVKTLRECARDLFVANGGTDEAFEQLSAEAVELWAGRVQR